MANHGKNSYLFLVFCCCLAAVTCWHKVMRQPAICLHKTAAQTHTHTHTHTAAHALVLFIAYFRAAQKCLVRSHRAADRSCSQHRSMTNIGGLDYDEKLPASGGVTSSTALAIRNSTIIAHRLSIYLPQLLLPTRDPQKVKLMQLRESQIRQLISLCLFLNALSSSWKSIVMWPNSVSYSSL